MNNVWRWQTANQIESSLGVIRRWHDGKWRCYTSTAILPPTFIDALDAVNHLERLHEVKQTLQWLRDVNQAMRELNEEMLT